MVLLRMRVLQQIQWASDLTLPINTAVNSSLTLKPFQIENKLRIGTWQYKYEIKKKAACSLYFLGFLSLVG